MKSMPLKPLKPKKPIKKTVLAAAFAACFCIGLGHGEAQTGIRSVWDGVYTEKQAERGEDRYARTCEHCHAPSLGGNSIEEVPALAWDPFLLRWSGKTVSSLFERIQRSMPADAPGSLTPSDYADVVAYILKTNRFPSGGAELGRDLEALKEIVIEKEKER